MYNVSIGLIKENDYEICQYEYVVSAETEDEATDKCWTYFESEYPGIANDYRVTNCIKINPNEITEITMGMVGS